jgi:hypothetical protein
LTKTNKEIPERPILQERMIFADAHNHEIQRKEKVVRVVEKKEKIVLPKLERQAA